MVCEGCGAVVDDVWSWCPDCGGLLSTESELDLADLPVDLRAPGFADGGPTLGPEQFPTEWAISA
ncbi:MAG TPA: hypothetical protein VFP61_05205 [Acidimicrobiales bacterium]|nr:hypothetical protein [Acidimicrobiales bacterium]